jgi:hypothetical protein
MDMAAARTITTDQEVAMSKSVSSFRSFDGSTIYVLADGRAVRAGVTGPMLLEGVGGAFVRYLTVGEFAEVTA